MELTTIRDLFKNREEYLGSLTACPHLRPLKAFTGFIFLSIFEFILARYLKILYNISI